MRAVVLTMVGAVVIVTVFAACAGRWMPTATDADAARVAERWPGTTKDDLNAGRKLLLGHCSSCHQPPSPAEKIAAEWGPQVDEMATRAGLASEDARMVERYLAAFAKDQDVAKP